MTQYALPLAVISASLLFSGCHDSLQSVFSDTSSSNGVEYERVETRPVPRHDLSKSTVSHHKAAPSAEIGSMSTPMAPEHPGGETTTLPATATMPNMAPAAPGAAPAAVTPQAATPVPTQAATPADVKKPTNQTVVPNVAPSLGE